MRTLESLPPDIKIVPFFVKAKRDTGPLWILFHTFGVGFSSRTYSTELDKVRNWFETKHLQFLLVKLKTDLGISFKIYFSILNNLREDPSG